MSDAAREKRDSAAIPFPGQGAIIVIYIIPQKIAILITHFYNQVSEKRLALALNLLSERRLYGNPYFYSIPKPPKSQKAGF